MAPRLCRIIDDAGGVLARHQVLRERAARTKETAVKVVLHLDIEGMGAGICDEDLPRDIGPFRHLLEGRIPVLFIHRHILLDHEVRGDGPFILCCRVIGAADLIAAAGHFDVVFVDAGLGVYRPYCAGGIRSLRKRIREHAAGIKETAVKVVLHLDIEGMGAGILDEDLPVDRCLCRNGDGREPFGAVLRDVLLHIDICIDGPFIKGRCSIRVAYAIIAALHLDDIPDDPRLCGLRTDHANAAVSWIERIGDIAFAAGYCNLFSVEGIVDGDINGH